MYFARFKMDGFMDQYADIAVFETERERDEWLNFEDEFTKAFGIDTKEDHEFDRIIVSEEEAKSIIEFDDLVTDKVNPRIKWYCRNKYMPYTYKPFLKASA